MEEESSQFGQSFISQSPLEKRGSVTSSLSPESNHKKFGIAPSSKPV
jgi:hypothetical protein